MRMRILLGILAVLVLGVATSARADQIVWSMESAGDGNLWKINVASNSATLIGAIKDPVLGDVGAGWSTVAETPDQTLYFLRRFQNDVNVYKLDSNNIQVSAGVIQNVVSIGPTGLSNNLDGLTAGPDGNLYLTAYQNSTAGNVVNGLFRFHPNSGVLDFVGTFAGDAGPSGPNSFYTDLAFDPITGDLFGTGFNSFGQFDIYRLNGALVLGGNNQTFAYTSAFSACGADGLAFDRVTGQLFESDDSGGVHTVDRTTGACTGFVANTGGTAIGSDLAVQSDTIPNPVPEPAALTLMGSGLTLFAGVIRRKIRR